MKNVLAFLILFLTAALSQKTPSGQNPCTAHPRDMRQMRECADYGYRKADARLSRVYMKALQFMKDDLQHAEEEGAQDQVRYEQAGINGLKQAQRAWLSYRDLQCAEAAQRYEGGTMAPLASSNCLKTLTDHRIDDLKSVYEQGEYKLE